MAVMPAATQNPLEIPAWMMSLNLLFSFGFFIFLYKFVPLFVATRIGHAVPALSGRTATNFVDGGIRIVIFLAFLLSSPASRTSAACSNTTARSIKWSSISSPASR